MCEIWKAFKVHEYAMFFICHFNQHLNPKRFEKKTI